MAQTISGRQLDPSPELVPVLPQPFSVLLIGLGRLTSIFHAGLGGNADSVEVVDESEAVAILTEGAEPDLILVGSCLDQDPFGLIGELRAFAPESVILFLSPTTRSEPALQAIGSGADDVVTPPHALSSVLLRVKILQDRAQLTRPQIPLPPQAASKIVIDRISRLVTNGEEPVSLTGREFELLERLLEERGQVVAREEILTDIWGERQSSEAVLDATVHRLRRKIEDNPARPKVLVTVRGIGYRLELESLHVVTF